MTSVYSRILLTATSARVFYSSNRLNRSWRRDGHGGRAGAGGEGQGHVPGGGHGPARSVPLRARAAPGAAVGVRRRTARWGPGTRGGLVRRRGVLLRPAGPGAGRGRPRPRQRVGDGCVLRRRAGRPRWGGAGGRLHARAAPQGPRVDA